MAPIMHTLDIRRKGNYAARAMDFCGAGPYAKSMKTRIKELRNAKGWNQERLALEVGTAQSTISRAESGKGNASVATYREIARALGCEWQDLFMPGSADPYIIETRELIELVPETFRDQVLGILRSIVQTPGQTRE